MFINKINLKVYINSQQVYHKIINKYIIFKPGKSKQLVQYITV